MKTKEDKLMLIDWLTGLDDQSSIERVKALKKELEISRSPFLIGHWQPQTGKNNNSLQNIVRKEVVVYTHIKDRVKTWRY